MSPELAAALVALAVAVLNELRRQLDVWARHHSDKRTRDGDPPG